MTFNRLVIISIIFHLIFYIPNLIGQTNNISSTHDKVQKKESTILELESNCPNFYKGNKIIVFDSLNKKYRIFQDSCWIALIFAVSYDGDIENVKNIVKKGCYLDKKIRQGTSGFSTPLSLAINHKNYEIAKYLIDHGADPNIDLGTKKNPMLLAAGYSPIKFLKYVLDHGGDVHTITSDHSLQTPMLCAVNSGSIKHVKMLLDYGADINHVYRIDDLETSISPLIQAVYKENYQMCKFLLDHGADFYTKIDIRGGCEAGQINVTVLDAILNQLIYNISKNHATLIHIFNLFLSKKPDFNIGYADGTSAILNICNSNDTALVTTLLKNGARINYDTCSCLAKASRWSFPIMVEYLLKKGANPNSLSYERNTPLNLCYSCCSDGFGSDIKINARIATIQLLLLYGANPYQKNERGISFLDLCKNAYRGEITDIMIKRGLLDEKDIIGKRYYHK